jgi:hypothetical protein
MPGAVQAYKWNHWTAICICQRHLYCLPTYLLLYSIEQSPSWEANLFSASQEIRHILWNQKVHYRSQKCPPPVPILSQLGISVITAWRVLRLRMEERPLIWRVAANIFNKQSRTADKEWSFSAWGLGELLTTPHCKKWSCCESQGSLYCCRLNLVFRVKCRERVHGANAVTGNSSFTTKSGTRASIAYLERIAFRTVSILLRCPSSQLHFATTKTNKVTFEFLVVT